MIRSKTSSCGIEKEDAIRGKERDMGRVEKRMKEREGERKRERNERV